MQEQETRSKIVCTIGPASNSREVLHQMVEAGMDVARINMSHEDHSSAKKTFELIRSVDDTVGILFDLQGPKIRIGEMEEEVELEEGDEFIISTQEFIGNRHRVSISHKDLPEDVAEGDIIAINDGIINLVVQEIRDNEVVTKVTNGGPISSRKGVNIPGIRLSCSMPTEKDVKDIELAAELGVDFIALSFVRDGDEVRRVNEILEENGLGDADVISKIEHMLAIENYDDILEESHGVMIARGDLGIEVPIEEVPVLQRELVRKANKWARPSIVATHMLESMTEERLPTRAEVSDVAHAIFDRTDAVMLSGETAIGRNPPRVVEMMNRIISNAEKRITPVDPLDVTSEERMIVEIIGNLVYSAVSLIPENVDGIVSATRSGFTARWISKFRPPTNIYAVTRDPAVIRRMRLLWGVHPVQYRQDLDNVDDLVQQAVRRVHKEGLVSEDKDVVFTSGIRHIPHRTNVCGVFHVADLI
ncbi:MAG: pyruvate kinase [Candidatus Thorarchaeota archaeon]